MRSFLRSKTFSKRKRCYSWFLTIFRHISNFRNKAKIWKFRSNNLVLLLFEGLYTNIWDQFWGRKISPKNKGVNPWFLTIFRLISNFRNKPKNESFDRITQFCPNSRDFTLIFEIIFEVEKFYQKVKGLTFGFRRLSF